MVHADRDNPLYLAPVQYTLRPFLSIFYLSPPRMHAHSSQLPTRWALRPLLRPPSPPPPLPPRPRPQPQPQPQPLFLAHPAWPPPLAPGSCQGRPVPPCCHHRAQLSRPSSCPPARRPPCSRFDVPLPSPAHFSSPQLEQMIVVQIAHLWETRREATGRTQKQKQKQNPIHATET